MHKILGRDCELKTLTKLIQSKEAELLTVYGRRRIGKTYLIHNFFKNQGTFFEWVGTASGTMREQLHNFPKACHAAFGAMISRPQNWQEAFSLLGDFVEKVPRKEKVILFFDELPWLAGQSSQMLHSLEHLWNRTLSKLPNVIVVLCGSAASWMIKKILHNRKGFYGRITQKIHLQPFSLAETQMYLEAKGVHLDRKQLAELYMLTGGVAKYLNHVAPGLSSAQVIQELCFSGAGFLHDEFYGLFASLFDASEKHIAVVRALGAAHYGLTHAEITHKTKIPSGGSLKTILEELEASGFIGRVPFFNKKKREAKFRVIDEYTLFYLRWIEKAPKRSLSNTYWLHVQGSAAFRAWCGYAFENLCFKHLTQIVDALKLSVIAEETSYWQDSEAQIDLLIERRDRCINLCEIKFSADTFTVSKEHATKLRHRKELFREKTGYRGTLFTTLITPFGAHKNPSYLSAIDQELSLDALFV